MKVMATLAAAVIGLTVWSGEPPEWLKQLRPEHPRLLLNKDIVAGIKTQIVKEKATEFRTLQEFVDKLESNPKLEFKNNFSLLPNGRVKFVPPAYMGMSLVKVYGGKEASSAALLYLLTGEAKYRDKGIAYLNMATEYLTWCLEHQVCPDWHSEVGLNTLLAYDWLYNDLTPADRQRLGKALLYYVKEVQPGGKAKYIRAVGGPDTGHYGTTSLLWPSGIIFSGAGIDDQMAADFLKRGYDVTNETMIYRDNISEGHGLLGAIAASYSFVAYPWSSFFFFHGAQAAFGQDLAHRYEHMRHFDNWFNWASIPLPNHAGFLHYGIGDTEHLDNHLELSHMYSHLAQLIHFYGRSNPEVAARARSLMQMLPPQSRKFLDWYPFIPLLLTEYKESHDGITVPPPSTTPEGYYFPGFGFAVMRSGYTPESTFAAFRSGSRYTQHQHYDENHFVIYKYGFQALDTGNRCTSLHHVNYYPQTVAHNAILIDMPNEPMPPFWHGPNYEAEAVKTNNDGGQNIRTNGICRDFNTNSHFTYICGDATKSYDAKKCRQAIREFVFVAPDYFVVYDRVESVSADQTKRWLIHTQQQPEAVAKGLYRAINGGGSISVQTLLPSAAVATVIGGPDNRFFTAGRNWPVTNEAKIYAKNNVMGQWRLEIKAEKPAAETDFLHLLAVGKADDRPVTGRLLESADAVGVAFTGRDGTVFEVRFNRQSPGGTIRAVRDGKEIYNSKLWSK